MASSVYCLDNDIILKLATCSLFEKTLDTFEVEINQVKILETFQYKFREASKRKRTKNPVNYNLEAALSVTELCNKISQVDINQDDFIQLRKIEEIDAGEAILLIYVSCLNQQNNLSYLLTGDKRCLKVLNAPEIDNIVQPLYGRIWCLEQLILKDIEVYGFDCIQKKIYPVRDCDTNLKLIFGYSVELSEDTVIVALENEITTLKQETKKLLYPYPD
ncbi:MAG: hypothetical protein HC890_16725 [Chloroflexaceae bacterium]|nr:hypothetical protein [Chloroflexaceae bacterium]